MAQPLLTGARKLVSLSSQRPQTMSTGIWSAAAGAVAQTVALDVAANNISNATTPGFRADRAVFRQELNQATDPSLGSRSLKYSIVRTVEPDRRQGQLVRTGAATDVALRSPDHWFAVMTPQGERYTRSGSLQRAGDGTLRTTDGFAYASQGGGPLQIALDAKTFSIENDGTLVVDGLDTGTKLKVVQFPQTARLVKEGSVLVKGAVGTRPPEPVTADLEVGALESSNASALPGMTSLVQAAREFEMLTRVIDAFSNLERRTAQEVAKGK